MSLLITVQPQYNFHLTTNQPPYRNHCEHCDCTCHQESLQANQNMEKLKWRRIAEILGWIDATGLSLWMTLWVVVMIALSNGPVTDPSNIQYLPVKEIINVGVSILICHFTFGVAQLVAATCLIVSTSQKRAYETSVKLCWFWLVVNAIVYITYLTWRICGGLWVHLGIGLAVRFVMYCLVSKYTLELNRMDRIEMELEASEISAKTD